MVIKMFNRKQNQRSAAVLVGCYFCNWDDICYKLVQHKWTEFIHIVSISLCLLLLVSCQLASRSVRHQIVPMVTIRLLLTRSSDVGSTHSCMDLQTDPRSLLHMISTLEAALAAVKTSHARRILRNIKWLLQNTFSVCACECVPFSYMFLVM